ncbi:hypothetical protein YC2023_112049 [Brassica napus]
MAGTSAEVSLPPDHEARKSIIQAEASNIPTLFKLIKDVRPPNTNNAKSGKMEKYVNDTLIPNVKEKSSKKYRRILQNNLE